MADQSTVTTQSATEAAKENRPKKRASKTDRGEISSGLSYVNATGVLAKILARIIEAPAPDRVTQDFLANVWGFTGGSAMAVIPFLKKVDFLSADGTPTEHYRNFRTQNRRNDAIRHALRAGFPDIYRQTDFAESAKDEKIADVVIGITGRSRTDTTIRAILGSFKVLVDFMNKSEDDTGSTESGAKEKLIESESEQLRDRPATGFNLGYQINIVLPETRDIEVFDAIFKKLKEHLL